MGQNQRARLDLSGLRPSEGKSVSYEGYERWLCTRGHLHEFDCYMTPDRDTWQCPVHGCNFECVWIENVDQTNDGGHPCKLKIAVPEVTEKCATCGHVASVERVRYKIPRNRGRTQ
jgi:hypothetical protein